MNGNKKEYDLIFSLGGNCAAAHNLRLKGLRFTSLPFDWLFISDSYTLKMLAECFQNDFKYFLLKENLLELQGNERGADHNGKMQYKDTYTQYRWVNHFEKSIDIENVYEEIKSKIDKRIARLYDFISKSDRVLSILNVSFAIDMELIKNLHTVLLDKFPNKVFDFVIMEFNSKEKTTFVTDNITVYKITREYNLDDFGKSNKEWNYLDNIVLSSKLFNKRIYKIKKRLLKFVTAFIPFKNIRKKIRKNFLRNSDNE